MITKDELNTRVQNVIHTLRKSKESDELGSMFFTAMKIRDDVSFTRILVSGMANIEVVDDKLRTPLLFAISEVKIPSIYQQRLIEFGANIVDPRDILRRNSVMLTAIHRGEKENRYLIGNLNDAQKEMAFGAEDIFRKTYLDYLQRYNKGLVYDPVIRDFIGTESIIV